MNLLDEINKTLNEISTMSDALKNENKKKPYHYTPTHKTINGMIQDPKFTRNILELFTQTFSGSYVINHPLNAFFSVPPNKILSMKIETKKELVDGLVSRFNTLDFENEGLFHSFFNTNEYINKNIRFKNRLNNSSDELPILPKGYKEDLIHKHSELFKAYILLYLEISNEEESHFTITNLSLEIMSHPASRHYPSVKNLITKRQIISRLPRLRNAKPVLNLVAEINKKKGILKIEDLTFNNIDQYEYLFTYDQLKSKAQLFYTDFLNQFHIKKHSDIAISIPELNQLYGNLDHLKGILSRKLNR